MPWRGYRGFCESGQPVKVEGTGPASSRSFKVQFGNWTRSPSNHLRVQFPHAYRSSSRPRKMDPQAQDLCDIGTVTPLSVLLPAHMRRRRPDRGKKVRQEETHVAAIELLDFVRLSSKEVCSTVAQSRDTFIIHKIHCHARLQLCTAHFPSH